MLCAPQGESSDEADINEGHTIDTCGSSQLLYDAYVGNVDNAKNNNESKTLIHIQMWESFTTRLESHFITKIRFSRIYLSENMS